VVVAANISRDQVEIVEENRQTLPGVEVTMKPVREYTYQNSAAHLLGYIGEVSEKELELAGYEEFNPGDYVGKTVLKRPGSLNCMARMVAVSWRLIQGGGYCVPFPKTVLRWAMA